MTYAQSTKGEDVYSLHFDDIFLKRDTSLEQGEEGAALLSGFSAFQHPTTVDAAFEVIEHLAEGRFLQPATS